MKFCGKCGSAKDESISFCGNCGEPLDNADLDNPNLDNTNKEQLGFNLDFSSKTEESDEKTDELSDFIINGNNTSFHSPSNNSNKGNQKSTLNLSKTKDNGNKGRKIVITLLSSIVVILLAAGILFHKPILSKIFLLKGDKAYIENMKIDYYCKSINYKYNKEAVDKISEVLNDLDDGEGILKSYENILSKKDFNNLMSNIYINKATKAFQNEQYEETMEIVKTAEKYGYNKSDFFYYNDTQNKLAEIEAAKNEELEKKKTEEEEKKKAEELAKKEEEKKKTSSSETIYKFIPSGDGFILPDSSFRKLTRSDLIGIDKTTLSIARNEMWARYGFIFQQEPFKSYFPRQNWYIPNPNAGGGMEDLTSIEQYNVRLIDDVIKNGI